MALFSGKLQGRLTGLKNPSSIAVFIIDASPATYVFCAVCSVFTTPSGTMAIRYLAGLG